MNPSEKTKVLNLYPIDYPFETLVDRAQKNKLILDPDFQRKYKWDKDGNDRCSKFIESCLMRIPLPACYFAEEENGNHLVIDGVQRITTIKRFFKDEFALEGLTIFHELNGKKFSELGNLRSELESTTIRCVILRKENPKGLVQEIFARLNQGAVQLAAQEIRHAIYPGSLDNLLQELSSLDVIKKFQIGDGSEKIKDSREDEELVLRFFAFNFMELDDYEDNMSKYLDDYMISHQNDTPEQIASLKNLFTETLDKCVDVFGRDSVFKNISTHRKRQSLYLYDLLMWSFSQYTKEQIGNKQDAIKQALQETCNDIGFKKSLSGRVMRKSGIKTRRTIWEEKLKVILS